MFCFVVFQDSKDIVLLSSEPMASEEKFLVICIIAHINIVLTLLFNNDAIWIPCGLFSCLFCLIIFGIIFFFLECWFFLLLVRVLADQINPIRDQINSWLGYSTSGSSSFLGLSLTEISENL